jgi:hypothetical protein
MPTRQTYPTTLLSMPKFYTLESSHAKQRAAQRSIPVQVRDLTMRFADIEIPAGDGAVALRLSRETAIGLAADGTASVELVNRALGTELIVGRGDVIVTCYRVDRRLRSRRNCQIRSRRDLK